MGDFILNFSIVLVFVLTLLFACYKVYSLIGDPYVILFDKVLIVIFYPIVGVLSYLFIIMIFGICFY